MSFFPNFATIVKIGNFSLRWYPVLLTTGGVLVYLLSKRNLLNDHYPDDIGDDIFIGCTIGGVIGARLWYCIFYDLDYYLANPITILKTWEGGLAIQGAIVGATIFVYFYCKKKHYSFMRILDCIFPNILIGQALGRWGNFFNHEAYGQITTLENLKWIPSFITEQMYIGGQYRQPTFLYESLLDFIGFILINFVYKKKSNPKRGDMVYAYLMWYGVVRTFVEHYRSDSLMIGSLKMAQVTAIFFLIVGVLGQFGLFRKLEKKPIIIFDFDQTICNSAPIIVETFRQLFETYLPNHPFTETEAKYVLGPTLVQSFTHFNFPKNAEELTAEYRALNDQLHTKELLKPMPYAKEVLEELHNQGYKIGVVSNKINRTIHKGAVICEFDEFLDSVYGSDKVTNHKPDPEGTHKCTVDLGGIYDNVIYVGDSSVDIKTGMNANAYTIGYNADGTSGDNLTGANIIVSDLRDILKIVKEEKSWTHDMN